MKHFYENGMEVTDLKKVMKFWKEKNANGDPTKVYIETSSGVYEEVKFVAYHNGKHLLFQFEDYNMPELGEEDFEVYKKLSLKEKDI